MAEENGRYWQDEDEDIELYMCSSDCGIKIEEWSLAAKGKFFSDEVYIVLNCTTNDKTGTTGYDIHCWVGKQASFKSYKRGLYNAIALDDAVTKKEVEGKPLQALVHREVQDYESKRFTNYFDAFTVLKGKSDEMAKVNFQSTYKRRLLRLSGLTAGRKLCVRETACKRGSLDSNDVFILDAGTDPSAGTMRLKIVLWIGRLSKDEKKVEKALEYARKLQAERGTTGITVVVVEESERTKNHPMYDLFPFIAKKRKPSRQESVASTPGLTGIKTKMMYALDDKEALLKFPKAGEGAEVRCEKMDCEKVTIIDVRFGNMDSEDHLFIHIGDECRGDRKSGLIYGHYFLKQLKTDEQHLSIAITVVKEGQQSHQLNAAIK
ncbi:hypothetical protein OS493_030574 [Desmophyllum pertusum]|uniref:Gelsolin-like domain-containing protein n=1 Tax=Desmophyllum pertusum TaxID=174260 RepID=A0A9W9YA62_9CNID|nr:hypothetical protein OS493_030574 [Desmophyllum pertusum]